MEVIKQLHAVSGYVVAIAGLMQILMKKGGRNHRLIGRLYFGAWIFVAASGAMIGSLLITFFGVLGFYMAYTGFRFAYRKKIEFSIIDTWIVYAGIAVGAGTLAWSMALFARGSVTFAIISMIFGALFLFATIDDLRKFVTMRVKVPRNAWYEEHFQRMTISYIAAMTAFSAINNVFGITLLNWLLPVAIGTGLVVWLSRRHRKKTGMAK